jgi:metal-sulfur cluster biosynthetic enzyme
MEVGSIADRREQVWDRLRAVTDPELDESVVDLGFITRAEVDESGRVSVGFRLPTYWCAANFSYLMADDMRRAVAGLPWVRGVSVALGEHMYADTINAGLARGSSFAETFGAEADGDIESLRRTFLAKAFQRRQAALLTYLRETGLDDASIVDMTIERLRSLEMSDEGAARRERYLERRDVVGEPAPEGRAFVDVEGDRLQAETLGVYLRAMRRVGVNAEFNSALCRGLLAARFEIDAFGGHASERSAAPSPAALGA